MWNEILELAIKNGIWAVLFLGLFIFVIKDSSNREKKYQQTIKDLTSHLGIVKAIKDDVDEIKDLVFNAKNVKKSSKNCKQDISENKETLKAEISPKDDQNE